MADSDIEQSRSPKRRRFENKDAASRYSSPDELAATPDGNCYSEPRSATLSRGIPEARGRSYDRSPDDCESPDELDHTAVFPQISEDFESDDAEEEETEERDVSVTPVPVLRARSPTPEKKEAAYVEYRQRAVLRGHKRGVAVVRFSPDGRMIASCCEFDRSTSTFPGQSANVFLFSIAADATIRIWGTASGKCLNILEGHLAGISTLAWSPDGKTVASGSDDKSIRLWDVASGKPYPHPLRGHHNYITTLCFSPKGNMIVSDLTMKPCSSGMYARDG